MSKTFIEMLQRPYKKIQHLENIRPIRKKKKKKARFKRRILHAPNRIAKLTACKMRRLNQLNTTHFNSMRVSRICD